MWFDGKNLLKITDDEIRQVRGNRIAMIFQDPMTSLNPVLTIGYQVSEALMLHLGMDKVSGRKRAHRAAGDGRHPRSAATRIDDYPHQFSGGMRQRVMIAMGLSCNPQLLIADEPTTALDVTIQAQITDLVKRLRDEIGMAIIWITHDLGVVAGLADRVIVMYAGFIVEEAPVKELYATSLPSLYAGPAGRPASPGPRDAVTTRLISIEGCRRIWSTCRRVVPSTPAASSAVIAVRWRILPLSRLRQGTRSLVGWMSPRGRIDSRLLRRRPGPLAGSAQVTKDMRSETMRSAVTQASGQSNDECHHRAHGAREAIYMPDNGNTDRRYHSPGR